MSKLIKVLTLFIFIVIGSLTKDIQTTFNMGQFKQTQGWLYIGKIALTIGNASINIKTQKIKGEARNHGGNITLSMISDDDWQNQNSFKCKDNVPQIKMPHELLLQNTISQSDHTVGVQKQQLYYFALKDCGKRFQTDYNNTQLQVKLDLKIINNGSFMGQQQDHWLIIPIIIGIGIWMMMTDKYFLKAEFQQDPDYAKMILFGAIGTNISSLMWKSFGYLIYCFRGSNYLLFHLIYLFMHSISQTMVLSLLVLISTGWSLNFLKGPKLDIAIPIISFLAIMNITLAFMTQLNNSAHDMHHTFDAPTGSILIVVRLILGFGLLISLAFTIRESRYRVRQFLKKFGFLSILYICSMPIIVLIANKIVPAKERNQFLFVSVQLLKTVCNISLMYMASSSRSQYNKLCYKNASFLPSQTGLF